MGKHGVCSDCPGLGHGFPHSQGEVSARSKESGARRTKPASPLKVKRRNSS